MGGAVYTRGSIERFARNDDVALATTAATVLLTWTPDITGTYEVTVAGYVANAATNLTLTVQYSDPNAPAANNPVTQEPYNNAAQAVGPFSTRVTIRAQGGEPVTVTATAGTANNISLSATVVRV